MNIKIGALFLLFVLPLGVAAEEAKITALSGSVEVRVAKDGNWVAASEGMEIPEGGAIKSGADGSAVVLMPNKTKIWLKESSTLEMEQRQTLTSRLSLLLGKMKIRVPHLMRKEKFEVRTPAAVCAVRGTEFTLDSNPDGSFNVQVLYGEVKLNFVIPPDGGASQFYIPQGRGLNQSGQGKPPKLALLTGEQEKNGLENWNPGLAPGERRKEMQQKDNDRSQIREFARVTNNNEDDVKGFLNNVKESDLEAGRTLKDAYGNTVRVDQRLVRPYADEVQFINLVKRPVYNNVDSASAATARGGFAYNGASGITNRLDYMQMTMNFNNDLPQRIEDWPSFFKDNSIKPEWASFVAANRTKSDEIFFISEGYKYDAVNDDLRNNIRAVVPNFTFDSVTNTAAKFDKEVILAGVIKDDNINNITAAAGLDNISRLKVVETNSGPSFSSSDPTSYAGTLKYSNTDPAFLGKAVNGQVNWAMKMDEANFATPASVPAHWTGYYDKVGDPYLWQYSADAYLVGNRAGTGGSAGDVLWFTRENRVINNSGSVQQVSDFTSSSQDPFTILKNSAGEISLSIKKSVGGESGKGTWSGATAATAKANAYTDISSADYYAYNHATNGTNIDLVFVPDLFVAAVQRILPAITELNK